MIPLPFRPPESLLPCSLTTHTKKRSPKQEKKKLTTTQPQCQRRQNHRQRDRKVVDQFLPGRRRDGHGSERCRHEFHSLVRAQEVEKIHKHIFPHPLSTLCDSAMRQIHLEVDTIRWQNERAGFTQDGDYRRAIAERDWVKDATETVTSGLS